MTADAMHTQRDTARRVTEAGGNHLLALEGNQGTLHDDVRIHLEDPENAEKMMFFKDVDKDHGRTGTREATVCHDVDSLQDLHHWPGLRAVGKVTATHGIKGERSTETRHFLPVERLGPERFLKTVRLHRAVENSLHWVLDVTMDGDRQRNRTASGPDSLALMRRLATDVARVAPGKDAMRGKLKKAGWSDDALVGLVRAAVGLEPPPTKS